MSAVNRGIELSEWDKVFSAPARFVIAVALEATEVIDFTELRKALDISSTLMSKHVSALEDAGYITVDKVIIGRAVKTELRMTKQGRTAVHQHRSLLERVAAFGEQADKRF